MKINHSSFLTFAVSGAFGALITQPVLAADIETLVGQVSDFAGPNVTLVVDTSGSMVSEVFIDDSAAQYDPTTNYTGPYDIHENFGVPTRLFYTLTPATSVNFPDENDVNSTQWVSPSAFACASGQSVLLSSGFYTDTFAQFGIDGDAAIWDFPTPANTGGGGGGQDQITECEADFGMHGDGSGNGSYPINIIPVPDNSQDLFPWSPSDTDPNVIDWDDTGARYSFFTPNFLNFVYERKQADDPVVLTRLEIVQKVASDLVKTLKARSLANNDGLRLGLMRFSDTGSGGMVLAPTTDIAGSGNEENLLDQIAGLNAQGSTPLAETMYEIYRYHSSLSPLFGSYSTPVTSVPTSLEGGNYKSPIESACQKNYVVLLTDGQPNGDFQANTEIGALTGGCTGSCLDEMTSYLSTTDLVSGSGFGGDQTLDTFIIGFFTDSALLQDATTGLIDTDGDDEPDTPGYFLASNPDQLSEAFDSIFGSGGIEPGVSTFTAPAVSVNSLNRLQNRDTLYFTLYEPSQRGEPHWNGNLKAYKIGRAGTDNSIQILDKDGDPAVDDTGLFKVDAVSLWGTEPDGREVTLGGVAARLSAQRNIYSDLSDNQDLNSDANRVSRDNADAIAALPGVPQGDELLELIDFAAGLDEEGMSRRSLGDPLHSQPLVITFDGGSDDLMLIFGTNDGYLHAVDPVQANDTSNDMEHFAFIPKVLIPQLATLKADIPSPFAVENKAYGMDGPITAWIEGADDVIDNDFVVESGETLWVYAAMRRGGRGYYAFDMSSRDNPQLEFKIDNTRAGYGDLGQTWSSASYARIKYNGDEKDVLIFGGGYDPNQDDSNTADSMGNAVYIADAKTGDLIWSAGDAGSSANLKLDAMTHSIPSDIRIIDTNKDGFIDRLYVGDMAAQVWRFDINPDPDTPDLAITGGRIAQLGGTGSANERRFYSAPSVSRYVEDGRGFLAIGIGSGYRAHPLDTVVDDKFYVLRDDYVYAPALNDGIPAYGDDNPALLTTETDMIELTLNGIADGSTTIATGDFGNGWFLELDASAGEKSLSSPVTGEGRIFFTTYSPENPALSCDPVAATGLGRFYGIDILTGLPALYDDALAEAPELSVELGPTGIPPQPKLVFVAPDCDGCSVNPGDVADDGLLVLPSTADIIVQVGTQAFDVGLAARPTRTYWVEF